VAALTHQDDAACDFLIAQLRLRAMSDLYSLDEARTVLWFAHVK
jgi:hypothetical protein